MKFRTIVTEVHHQRSAFYIYEISPKKITYSNSSWYQLNFWVSLGTMLMGICGKYMTTCIGILDIHGLKSKFGHHGLKVMDNKIVTITQELDYK